MTMKASVKNFMSGLIDYAGLFPPARLEIKTTLANYAGYLAGENGWMLGRCLIPATRLHQVGPHPGFRYSVIVSPALSDEELEQLGNFSRSQGRVEMVETRLPDSTDSPERCSDHLLHLASRLNRAALRDIQLFVEAGTPVSAALLAASLAAFNSRRAGGKAIKNAGYKLRCGGTERQAYPTVEKVAAVIAVCRTHDVPIKFTAGMHHPLRNHSPEMDVMQHGFVNMFAAGLLGWDGNLSTDQIAACLGDETAAHFHFAEEGFSWLEHTISADEIKCLRQNKVISFGSCSFAEPVEGLRSLGLLDDNGA
jgi:hypothetical protein